MPQPVENIGVEEAGVEQAISSPTVQIEQAQHRFESDLANNAQRAMRLGASPELMREIQNRGMENALKLAGARATLEFRTPGEVINKLVLKKKMGDLFQVTLQQDAIGTLDAKSDLSKETARLKKTVGEVVTSPGVVLGFEKYQGGDKTKPYFGLKLEGSQLKIAFLGEAEMEKGKTTMNARIKAEFAIADQMNLFANIALTGVNKRGELGISQLNGLLGLNITKDQAVAIAFDPAKTEGCFSYIGRF
jgi:hypothetical protein